MTVCALVSFIIVLQQLSGPDLLSELQITDIIPKLTEVHIRFQGLLLFFLNRLPVPHADI